MTEPRDAGTDTAPERHEAPRPGVSLIVCTRNRASQLDDFLGHVSRLEDPPGGWELILVDNGSTDATPSVLESFARGARMRVRIVQAPVPGLARARNKGVAAAAGKLLVFTDDDCYPRPDFLLQMAAVFERHRVGFAGGRIVLHDPTDAAVTIKDAASPQDLHPFEYVRPGVIHGANMAVSRELVRSIGGFDPHLGAGTPCVAAEDVEYVARAGWAGWRGRYDPGPTVAHHHGRKPGAAARRHSEGHDFGRGAYFLKLILSPSSRRTYAKHWYWQLRRRVLERDFRAPLRQFRGAARYIIERMLHPEPVPSFDDDDAPLGPDSPALDRTRLAAPRHSSDSRSIGQLRSHVRESGFVC